MTARPGEGRRRGADALDVLALVCRREHRDAAVRVVRPYGSQAGYLPGSPPRRVFELDRDGAVTLAIRRSATGIFEAAWVRTLPGSVVGVVAGGADHPLWGPSDRIVSGPECAQLLTVAAAIDWDRPEAVPPLAEPARLPPGGGSALLNLLAGLAADQATPSLRYRGPYATEQLFWSLVESFRLVPAPHDSLAVFLAGAEEALLEGAMRDAPVDWAPAPHESVWLAGGIGVQLRDGVEKVMWDGRTYHRTDGPGLTRREHRVVRPARGPDGERRFVVGLSALGRPLEDHLVLADDGRLIDGPGFGTPAACSAEAPLDPLWRDALAALLPLEATPLLRPAIAAVWPGVDVAWAPVARDLVTARDTRIRLSPALVVLHRADAAARPASGRRELAQVLVREVLGLLGPPVRRAAAAWLEALAPDQRAERLHQAIHADRGPALARAAQALGRLLDALVIDEALPPTVPSAP